MKRDTASRQPFTAGVEPMRNLYRDLSLICRSCGRGLDAQKRCSECSERTMFSPGDRVTATLYGERKEGTVTKHTSSIVWVLWDGHESAQWQNPESLTPLTNQE